MATNKMYGSKMNPNSDKYKKRKKNLTKKADKNKLTVHTSQGTAKYKSAYDYDGDPWMKNSARMDKELGEAPDKILKEWANHTPTKRISFTGKVLGDTEVADNRIKLAKRELERRKKARMGKGPRAAGQDSPGGKMK
jgi:hypothetical protein